MPTAEYQAALRLSKKLGLPSVDLPCKLMADKPTCHKYLVKMIPIQQHAKQAEWTASQVVDLLKTVREKGLTFEQVTELLG